MPAKIYDTFRPMRPMDGEKPIRRTANFTPSSLKPVTPPWIPKMAGPRRTAKKASLKGAKVIKASTFEDM